MLKVYIANHPAEAHLVKGVLESHGIACQVQGEFLYGARGELPITPETAPSVWIMNHTQFEAARSIIAAYEKSLTQDTSDGETWICKACGEESEGQFSECWNCSTPRELP
jgi:hypothetical protein